MKILRTPQWRKAFNQVTVEGRIIFTDQGRWWAGKRVTTCLLILCLFQKKIIHDQGLIQTTSNIDLHLMKDINPRLVLYLFRIFQSDYIVLMGRIPKIDAQQEKDVEPLTVLRWH